MKAGLLERILTRRYGQPVASIRHGMSARLWNTHPVNEEAVLYVGMNWHGMLGFRFSTLREVYGDALGGFLVGDSLRAALLGSQRVYALWNIGDFQKQPEIQRALVMDPAVDYFMDAYMVYFYGVKKDQLYVFDGETDELDCLGPLESALETVMEENIQAGKDLC